MEVAYANFCGARSILVTGPRHDGKGRDTILYARAIQEALAGAGRANIIIHLPMYREPGLEEQAETLTSAVSSASTTSTSNIDESGSSDKEIDLFGAWDTWNTIRSICEYSLRLFVGTCHGLLPSAPFHLV